MPLTTSTENTGGMLVAQTPELAKGLLEEAMELMVSGEADTARLLLRDVVNGLMGFEVLGELTGIPSKSLHRMLSVKGNPTMDNLSLIMQSIKAFIEAPKLVSA